MYKCCFPCSYSNFGTLRVKEHIVDYKIILRSVDKDGLTIVTIGASIGTLVREVSCAIRRRNGSITFESVRRPRRLTLIKSHGKYKRRSIYVICLYTLQNETLPYILY